MFPESQLRLVESRRRIPHISTLVSNTLHCFGSGSLDMCQGPVMSGRCPSHVFQLRMWFGLVLSRREQAVDGENGNDSALYGDDVRDRQFCAILHRFKAVRGNVADAQNLVHQNAGGRPFEDR